MIIMPGIFERLCLRLKAGDETVAMNEPVIESGIAGNEAEEARVTPDGPAPQQPPPRQEEQICVPQGTLPFKSGYSSEYSLSNFPLSSLSIFM
jgi:hypothetical protein